MDTRGSGRIAKGLGIVGFAIALAITAFMATKPPPDEEPAADPAPAAAVAPALQPRCPEESRPMARLELVFGLSRKGAEPVTDAEWQEFLDTEVTPRFPDGLTVLTGYGQWRGKDGKVAKEASRILLVWHVPDETTEARIIAIREAWKTRFNQESVLRADDATSCVSF